jgi:hypothetical protein
MHRVQKNRIREGKREKEKQITQKNGKKERSFPLPFYKARGRFIRK